MKLRLTYNRAILVGKLLALNSLLIVRVEKWVRWLSWGPPQNRVQKRNYILPSFGKRARPLCHWATCPTDWSRLLDFSVLSHVKQASSSMARLWTQPDGVLAISGINGRLAEYIVVSMWSGLTYDCIILVGNFRHSIPYRSNLWWWQAGVKKRT